MSELSFYQSVSAYQIASAWEAMDDDDLRDFILELIESVGDEFGDTIIQAFVATRSTPAGSDQRSDEAGK